MSTSIFDQWSSLQSSKMSLAPILEFNSITTRLCAELCRQNLQAMDQFAQNGQAQLQGLSRLKGLDDALQSQAQFLSDTAPQVLRHAEQILDTVLASAQEYHDLFEANMPTKASMKPEVKSFPEKFKEKERSK